MPVSVDASKTLISGVSALTWANRPSSANATGLYLFTNIGTSGTLMRYAGSRWRPLAGQAQLASLGAAVTGIANSEQIVLQTLIPAAAWQTNDTIRLFLAGAKSGGTDAGALTVRVGTDGTTADTALTGLSAANIISAANLSWGLIIDIKLISATSAQKMGGNGNGGHSYFQSTAAAAAATTITDVSANAVYLSVGFASAGATNTVSVTSGQIQLITP